MTGFQLVPILMYHSVFPNADTDWRQYTVTPALFAEHLRYLREHDYCSLTVSAFAHLLAAGADLPPRTVILTFDDGHRDFATEALPILECFGMAATLYVTTGFIGRRSPWQHRLGMPAEPMLSWNELRDIHRAGVECGAHGVSHEQLDTLPRAQALAEIVTSKRVIEEELGHQVATLSYPHGRYDRVVQAMVVDAGYVGACSTTRAISNTADDQFGLARIPIMSDTTVNQLAGLLTGDGLRVAPVPERLQTRVWRYARQAARAVRSRRPRNRVAA